VTLKLGWILPQRIGILKEPDLDFPSLGRFFYRFFYCFSTKKRILLRIGHQDTAKTIHRHIIQGVAGNWGMSSVISNQLALLSVNM
jgi:hypothetical protein